jgi:hypothetical protein
MHVDDLRGVIGLMAAGTKPGGAVVFEDAHFEAVFTSPPCPANDLIYGKWYPEAVRRRGGDPNIGPRPPLLLEAAGRECLGIDAAQPAHFRGSLKQLPQLSAAMIRDGVVRAVGVDEFNRAHAELVACTNSPAPPHRTKIGDVGDLRRCPCGPHLTERRKGKTIIRVRPYGLKI